jgi:hypothetical protein
MQKPEEKNETSMFLSLESILAPSTCIRTNIEADIEQLAASVKADAILDHLIVRASKVLAKYYPVNFVDEVVKRFGDPQPSFDKVLENIIAVLGVAWSKIVELDLVEEMFREAEAWHQRKPFLI